MQHTTVTYLCIFLPSFLLPHLLLRIALEVRNSDVKFRRYFTASYYTYSLVHYSFSQHSDVLHIGALKLLRHGEQINWGPRNFTYMWQNAMNVISVPRDGSFKCSVEATDGSGWSRLNYVQFLRKIAYFMLAFFLLDFSP